MDELSNLIINNDKEIRIDNIFERLLTETEYYNSKYPNCWKKTIFELYQITCEKCVFDENVTAGIMYLFAMVWHTVCPQCDDHINNWLHTLAKAWLLRDDLPIFIDCTCDNEGYY